MKQADAYKTNNIVVYMGSDYTYENAEVWFTNLDKLIKYFKNILQIIPIALIK